MIDLVRRLREYGHFLKSLANTNLRLLWGMWRLTKLPQPAITVFGGSRVARDSKHAIHAEELGKLLAAGGFSIITGGGPGIMEAANRGAMDFVRECDLKHQDTCGQKLVSAGIGLIKLNKEKANDFVQENIVMEHFFSRKWLLVRYSVGFVVFPGGFGTFDELFEIITLLQCNRMQRAPVILFDIQYWQPLLDWIEHYPLAQGFIGQEDKNLITPVDDVLAAYKIIQEYCHACSRPLVDNGGK